MKAVALFAAFVALAVNPLSARDGQQPGPTFRSAAALVALNVTVQDGGSKFVPGLQPADFVVYEDGVKQTVEFFESTRVPVDLIVMLDTSASMRDKLGLVHQAASGFLATLRPEDRGAVLSFASSVSVLQPLTSDHAALQRAVGDMHAGGSTSLNNAVYIALKQFGLRAQSADEVRRQAIVILSDGADTTSLVSFDDVLALARRLPVSIYTVSLQSPPGVQRTAATLPGRLEEEADYTMKTLAKETGAQSFFPTPDALKGVYAAIAAELASQYSIGYVPANTQADGRFRRVNVQVVTRPDLRSRTRLGYTAGAASSLLAAHNQGQER